MPIFLIIPFLIISFSLFASAIIATIMDDLEKEVFVFFGVIFIVSCTWFYISASCDREYNKIEEYKAELFEDQPFIRVDNKPYFIGRYFDCNIPEDTIIIKKYPRQMYYGIYWVLDNELEIKNYEKNIGT